MANNLEPLTETYPLDKVCFLIDKTETPDDIRDILVKILASNGVITVDYRYSKELSYGRQYCVGKAYQRLDNNTRNFLLCDENIMDIDMVGASPSILKYFCEEFGITKTPRLNEYVLNKEQVLKKCNVLKSQVNCATCKEKPMDTNNKWLLEYQSEINMIREKLVNHKSFIHIKKDITKKKFLQNKTENVSSSILTHIVQEMENEIIIHLIKLLQRDGVKPFSKMFDGVVAYGSETPLNLDKINKNMKETYGDTIRFKLKPFKSDIVMPNSYVYNDDKRKELLRKYCRSYEMVKSIWEDSAGHNATLVRKYSSYFVRESGVYTQFRPADLRTSYQSWKYDKVNKDGIEEEECFIDRWVYDEHRQEKYDIEEYAELKNCNPSNLNIYERYDVLNWDIKDFKYDEEAVKLFTNHIASLTNYDDKVALKLLEWFANMFQYPDAKCGLCPVIVSDEGVGKDLLILIISLIMGTKKVLTTLQPEQDVWGKYNSLMVGVKLINISEISAMNTASHMGAIRGIITSPVINIDTKGQKQYQLNSNHSLMVNSNYDVPIKVDDKQRRFMLARASNENIGDANYFSKLIEITKNKNSLKSIYIYLMEMKNVPEVFDKSNQVVSEYQKEIQSSYGDDDYKAFLKERCIKWYLDKKETKTEEIKSLSLFTEFLKWRYDNKLPNKEWNMTNWGIKFCKLKTDFPECFGKKRKNDGIYTIIHHVELFDYWDLTDVVANMEKTADDVV